MASKTLYDYYVACGVAYYTVPTDEVPLPHPGAVDFSTTIGKLTHTTVCNLNLCVYCVGEGEGEGEVLEKALHRMSERVQQRRVLTKPCFQDFDKSVTLIVYTPQL